MTSANAYIISEELVDKVDHYLDDIRRNVPYQFKITISDLRRSKTAFDAAVNMLADIYDEFAAHGYMPERYEFSDIQRGNVKIGSFDIWISAPACTNKGGAISIYAETKRQRFDSDKVITYDRLMMRTEDMPAVPMECAASFNKGAWKMITDALPDNVKAWILLTGDKI